MYQTLPSEKYIQDKFKCDVENTKNIFNKEKFKTVFQKLGRLTLVEFRDAKNSINYSIKFIFDQKDSTLYISGDLGSAVFSWYSSRNTFWTMTHFAKNTGYFMEKRQTDTDIHEYDSKLAKLQIKEIYADLKETNIENLNEEETKELKNFFECTFENTDQPLSASEIEELHDELYHENWIDEEPDYGRLLGSRPIIWLTALTEIKNHPITFMPKTMEDIQHANYQ
jgi:vacuolar-type H+-ATPase subunit I/STV1